MIAALAAWVLVSAAGPSPAPGVTPKALPRIFPPTAASSQGSAAGTVLLGTYKIGGQNVEARIPDLPGPFAGANDLFAFQGSRYLVRNGKLIRRLQADGGWSEIRAAYDMAKAKIGPRTPEWKVKVFVLGKADLLDRASSGLLTERVYTFENRHHQEILESLARFAAIAEGAAGGALRVTVDVEYDTDWARFKVDASRGTPSQPFAQSFAADLMDYVRPRINGGTFETDDRVYRGPWDSVFVIHSAMTGPAPDGKVYDAPVSPISLFLEGQANGPYGLTFALANRWDGHVRAALHHWGYVGNATEPHSPESGAIYASGEELMQPFQPISATSFGAPKESWGKALNRKDPSSAELALALSRTDAREGLPSADWGKARYKELAAADLSKIAGAPVAPSATTWGAIFARGKEPVRLGSEKADGVWEWGKEAMAAAPGPARSLLFVDPVYADLFAAHLKPELDPKLHGVTRIGPHCLTTFSIKGMPENATEASLLAPEIQNRPAPRASGFRTAGTYQLRGSQGLDRPGAIVSCGGFPRSGGVWLSGGQGTAPIASGPFEGAFSVWLKPDHPEPMVLAACGAGGERKVLGRLFGVLPNPAESQSTSAVDVLEIDPTGGWQQVTVKVSLSEGEVWTGIALESDPNAGCWEVTQPFFDSKVAISEPILKAGVGESLTPSAAPKALVPDAKSQNPFERALFAASAPADAGPEIVEALIGLLDDSKDVVVMNAVAAFSRNRSDAAIPKLQRAFQNVNHRVSEQAAAALAFQGDGPARQILKRALEIGPYDFCREFAARQLASLKDDKMLIAMSILAVGPSWRARVAGAEAVGVLPGDGAAKTLMLYVKNADPGVRLAATLRANPAIEDVAKNMLYGAVNDESDWLRFQSATKLLESPLPGYREEGLKVVRDDSKWVRLLLLDYLRARPNESNRGALRLAVADASPEVRAAALMAFAAHPGKVEAAEVEGLDKDLDPRVQGAYAFLAAAKGIRP
ncbi:MAG: HEAT repeat domain-containing protein [Armatimonadetes bacterium]|nr:HEAT repeat domain-containing protein [Armatimonadota bacterium]